MAKLTLQAHSTSMLCWMALLCHASQHMRNSPKVRTAMIAKSKEESCCLYVEFDVVSRKVYRYCAGQPYSKAAGVDATAKTQTGSNEVVLESIPILCRPTI